MDVTVPMDPTVKVYSPLHDTWPDMVTHRRHLFAFGSLDRLRFERFQDIVFRSKAGSVDDHLLT